MGCDYYEHLLFCFDYIDKNGNMKYDFEILETNRRYLFEKDLDYDFETFASYLKRLEENSEEINLFVNNKWLCLENRAREYYNVIEKRLNGELGTLIRVYKKYSYMAR